MKFGYISIITILLLIATSLMPFLVFAQDSLVVTEDGKIGVGTTEPENLLHLRRDISGGLGAVLHLSNDYGDGNPVNNSVAIVMGRRNQDRGTRIQAIGQGINFKNSDLTFQMQNDGEGYREVLRIKNNGNVGIGTMNPEHLLEVRGTSDSLSIGDDTNTQTYARFAHHRTMIGYSGSHALFQSGLGKEMRFNVNSNTYNSGTVAMAIDTDGNVAIGTLNPQGYKLYVNGTAFCNSGTWSGSDARWKKNIKPLEDSLGKIDKLQGVTYEWDKEQFSDQEFEKGTQIGLVAQEVENVFPQLVRMDGKGYKAVSYEKLTAVLLEAVKVLKAENQELKQRLDTLEKVVMANINEEEGIQTKYLSKK